MIPRSQIVGFNKKNRCPNGEANAYILIKSELNIKNILY